MFSEREASRYRYREDDLLDTLFAAGAILATCLLASGCSFLPCPANDRVRARLLDAERSTNVFNAGDVEDSSSESSSDFTAKIVCPGVALAAGDRATFRFARRCCLLVT
jgi:hypothetical protein